jgi:PAS domain S-box-containing protein
LADWFITSETRDWVIATCFQYSYDGWLVALSLAVAVFASYTSLHLVARMVAAGRSPTGYGWLATGAVTMGAGIWSMHFIAMLAVRLPAVVRYDLTLTALSMVFAIAASAYAFYFVGRGQRTPTQLAGGGVVLGAGIGAMHYTGMAAVRADATVIYDPALFAVSIVVAVVLSTGALRLWFHTLDAGDAARRIKGLASAGVMGLSIAALHYTGMAATYFMPAVAPAAGGTELDGPVVAAAFGGAAMAIAALSLALASIDRHLKIKDRQVRQSEYSLNAIVNFTAEGIISIDEAGVVRSFNPAAERIFGYDMTEVLGNNVSMLVAPAERSRHDGYVRNSELHVDRIQNLVRGVVAMRKDGSTFTLEL